MSAWIEEYTKESHDRISVSPIPCRPEDLGYSIGSFFVGPSTARSRGLLLIGALMALSFLLLRLAHLCGDPVGWAQR